MVTDHGLSPVGSFNTGAVEFGVRLRTQSQYRVSLLSPGVSKILTACRFKKTLMLGYVQKAEMHSFPNMPIMGFFYGPFPLFKKRDSRGLKINEVRLQFLLGLLIFIFTPPHVLAGTRRNIRLHSMICAKAHTRLA